MQLPRSLALCAPTVAWLPITVALVGCGSAPVAPSAPSEVATSAGGEVELAELLRENDTLRARVEDVEGRLTRVEAENAELRAQLTRSARTVDTADFDVAEVAEADEAPVSDRPVLRLHGPPVVERPALAAAEPLAGPPAPLVVAPPPTGTLGRLVVTGSPDDVPAIPTSPALVVAPSAPAPDPAAGEYQEALRLLSDRDVEGALRAFDAFVTEHPDHAYADNALYFRGEIHYARRAYREAIVELERLLARYPHGSRVADALLRIGTCWERLGDSARAATYFERVRREHPTSAAARMAEREDT